MKDGLPDTLARVRRMARMRKNIERMLDTATLEALEAGHSAEDINTQITHCEAEPPVGAHPQWVAGWECARDGNEDPNLAARDSEFIQGFEAFMLGPGSFSEGAS